MSFKNKREIYQALVDGKKITESVFPSTAFIHFEKNGIMVDEKGKECSFEFNYPTDWQEFKEPKKITLYRYIYQIPNGDMYQTEWRSVGFDGVFKLLKTESKEIEIEE